MTASLSAFVAATRSRRKPFHPGSAPMGGAVAALEFS
jgi:hypothetical protein